MRTGISVPLAALLAVLGTAAGAGSGGTTVAPQSAGITAMDRGGPAPAAGSVQPDRPGDERVGAPAAGRVAPGNADGVAAAPRTGTPLHADDAAGAIAPGGVTSMPFAAPREAPASQTLSAFLAEADAMLLAGEQAPPDLPLRLMALAPADRMLAVAYLRRIGVLTGPALPLDLLIDATTVAH